MRNLDIMARRTMVNACTTFLERTLTFLEAAMRYAPGPYPDPDCPIEKWQLAHEHLVVARDLLRG